MRFYKYLQEERKIPQKDFLGISFVDIDETMFSTYAKIHVFKDGKKIKELTNQEFNTYELKSGESFGFDEFRDAEVFQTTSKPINRTIDRVKKMINLIKSKSKGSRIVFLTARADFDDKQKVLDLFRKHGVDVDYMPNVWIKRAGNLTHIKGTSNRKLHIIRQYLDDSIYKKARMFDDDMKNLKDFLTLKKEYPKIQFFALLVMPNGKLKRIG